MVYLFLGQDNLAKNIKLKAIRQESLAKGTEQFNLDILYGKELTLKTLQEKLLALPAKSAKRIVIIKDAEGLKDEVKEFVVKFAKSPYKHIILILDIENQEKKDNFASRLFKYAKTTRFKETIKSNAFTLSRQISARRPDYALRVLNELLTEGERPERILGGLRYVWERDSLSPQETRRRLKLLVNCDVEIKTGRLKPNFALEKLVVSLCRAGSTLG